MAQSEVSELRRPRYGFLLVIKCSCIVAQKVSHKRHMPQKVGKAERTRPKILGGDLRRSSPASFYLARVLREHRKLQIV